MLDQILDLLLLWTGVERGLLLLRAPGDKLVIRAARNLEKNDLSQEQRLLSHSMAKRALSEGRAVVAVDAMHDISQIHRSVHALHLRSVLAVPLTARGEVLGVAYLDDKVRRGAFGERELSWVNLISTVAAVAIADEHDRLRLRRALRRATRAESRLENQLSSREAQLELAERELSRIQDGRKLHGKYEQIVGRSVAMMELLTLVDRVALSEVPVLIQGESGTGKELIARAIAATGERKKKPFVAENCSALPETLLESTLFGHQKGAFTGASRNQTGLFELAHQGILFLDEIGDMSMAMQAKLLRVLQEGEVRPLGSERMRKVDVRVIVATHVDLKEAVRQGTFREDLYYRLNVVTVTLPPLRERREDILPLVEHFVEKYAAGRGRTISQAALLRLANFSWPGNVRQLENEVRRMLVLGGEEITAADLSPDLLRDSESTSLATTLREKVDALERRLVVEALEQAHGNRTRAAEALGVSRFGLQKMTQRLQIDLPKGSAKAGRTRDRGLDETQ
jgi:transcriptional regulator with GAF, ATPase, and Fis domain